VSEEREGIDGEAMEWQNDRKRERERDNVKKGKSREGRGLSFRSLGATCTVGLEYWKCPWMDFRGFADLSFSPCVVVSTV
jgi:hypothetical protein